MQQPSRLPCLNILFEFHEQPKNVISRLHSNTFTCELGKKLMSISNSVLLSRN